MHGDQNERRERVDEISTIAQEECMDIILTSGLLNRSDPITNPSSKMLLGGRVYSVEAIDKLLNDHATDGEKEEEVDLEEQKYEMTMKVEIDGLYEVGLEIVTASSSEFWFGDGFSHIF